MGSPDTNPIGFTKALDKRTWRALRLPKNANELAKRKLLFDGQTPISQQPLENPFEAYARFRGCVLLLILLESSQGLIRQVDQRLA
jgi:hypothetical protein